MVEFVDAHRQRKISLWLLRKCKLEDFQFLKLDSIDQLCHFCWTNVQFYGNKSTVYLCELLHLVVQSSTFDNISSFIIKILCPFHSPPIIPYPLASYIFTLPCSSHIMQNHCIITCIMFFSSFFVVVQSFIYSQIRIFCITFCPVHPQIHVQRAKLCQPESGSSIYNIE